MRSFLACGENLFAPIGLGPVVLQTIGEDVDEEAFDIETYITADV